MCKENSLVRFLVNTSNSKFPLPYILTSKRFSKRKKKQNFIVVPFLKIPTQQKTNHYVPSGFCSCSMFAYREVENLLKLYRGKDCMEVFCKHIESEADRLYNMRPEMPMKCLTQDEWREFNRATKCHMF